jgi:hypothetical protein
MGQKLDFECLNFDRELSNLREAAANLQSESVACRPALVAYIEALKTLSAEMLGRLDPILRALRDSRGARQSLGKQGERRQCQGAAAQSQTARDTVHPASTPISNGRGRRRIGAA